MDNVELIEIRICKAVQSNIHSWLNATIMDRIC